MPFFYRTGERIEVGDHVLVHGDPGEIEFVSDRELDPTDWYVLEFGGGAMILAPKSFGRVFISEPADCDAHVEFVSRKTSA
jgi:hypothetical protein